MDGRPCGWRPLVSRAVFAPAYRNKAPVRTRVMPALPPRVRRQAPPQVPLLFRRESRIFEFTGLSRTEVSPSGSRPPIGIVKRRTDPGMGRGNGEENVGEERKRGRKKGG